MVKDLAVDFLGDSLVATTLLKRDATRAITPLKDA